MGPEPGKAPFLASLVRQPLVQFLAVGLLLFLGMAWLRPAANDRAGEMEGDGAQAIRVDRDSLLAFVQTRTQEPDASRNALAFDALDEAGKRRWVERFVREEALVREAKALGLDREDELIRRRLVQKIEFVTRGVVDDSVAASDSMLAAFLAEHEEDYRLPTLLAFSHVFVRTPETDSSTVQARAIALREQLNRSRLDARAALSLGDRFLYNRSYSDRTLEEVRSHFGEAFAASLTEAAVDPTRWIGPIESVHGLHLVLLTRRVDSRLPLPSEISETLRNDLMGQRKDDALEKALREIVAKYPVELEGGLEEALR